MPGASRLDSNGQSLYDAFDTMVYGPRGKLIILFCPFFWPDTAYRQFFHTTRMISLARPASDPKSGAISSELVFQSRLVFDQHFQANRHCFHDR